jgi:hypothetical protein
MPLPVVAPDVLEGALHLLIEPIQLLPQIRRSLPLPFAAHVVTVRHNSPDSGWLRHPKVEGGRFNHRNRLVHGSGERSLLLKHAQRFILPCFGVR